MSGYVFQNERDARDMAKVIRRERSYGGVELVQPIVQDAGGGSSGPEFGSYASGWFSQIPPNNYPSLTILDQYYYSGTVAINASLYNPGSTLSSGSARLKLVNETTGIEIVYAPVSSLGYHFFFSNSVPFSGINAAVIPITLTGTFQIQNKTGAAFRIFCSIDGLNCLGNIASTHWTYSFRGV